MLEIQKQEFKGGGGIMNFEKIFPTLIIILHIGAGVAFIPNGNVGKIIYYLSGAALNIAIAYLM